MNETLKAVILALITALPAYVIMLSQRRKNISESDASSAEAAAKLNAQTINMINTMRQDLVQQKHSTETLQDKVFVLEHQLKAEREGNYLYKKYINYVLNGDEQNRTQLQNEGKQPVFVPITLEAFEAAENA